MSGRISGRLFVDEAHDLNGNTLTGLKCLMELVEDGDGSLSVILAGHPKLRNDLRRATMEEIGYRTDNFSLDASPAASMNISTGCSAHVPATGSASNQS
ncbi:hypothetical protein [Cupriavidus oxalaticus]|uniref:hypothetical protein n=1 Tax=Cupriavidus oxalaticus TaxID=96344 RepID=UPI00197A8865|nr:hypothetical protein [Cupriavidus oxalaticus]